MKIKKVQLTNSTLKLFKLKLIKSKVYKFNEKNIKLENIEIRLKKVLQIIYEYHKNKKKILFIGVPLKFSKSIQFLFQKTRHIFLPNSIWVNGILTNQYSCFQYILSSQKPIKNKMTNLLFKLRNKSDLIVILNASETIPQIIEGHKTKTPIIAFNSSFIDSTFKITYKIPGYFHFYKNEFKNNFFYYILASIFKKFTMNKIFLSNFRNKNNKK